MASVGDQVIIIARSRGGKISRVGVGRRLAVATASRTFASTPSPRVTGVAAAGATMGVDVAATLDEDATGRHSNLGGAEGDGFARREGQM
jgi:hypothetical protein